jgi:MoaA/NifB/PqqE/SkfB family radical SAM enzyme
MSNNQSIAPAPQKVTIETTSVCNIRCVMCPQAIGLVRRAKHLPESIVEKLRPSLATARYFELHGIGEPLLSPAFWRIVALLRELNPTADAIVNTNLVVLTDKMLADLAASTLTLINVSLDAATPETYRKIRGEDFAKVTSNIRRLVAALRARQGARNTKLAMNMTVMKENLAEVPAFVRLASELGVNRALVWPINDYGPADTLMQRWETNLRDWHFVYREQLLTDIPELVSQTLATAGQTARELGMEFEPSNFLNVRLGSPA